MSGSVTLSDIATTQYIESHQDRINKIRKLANEAFATQAPFVTTELWMYIINTLESRNGTGVACPLQLVEFQTQQFRRYNIDPGTCREAWNTLNWPFTVSGPVLTAE